MRVVFTGKSTSITDREKEYAEQKLQRLARYFNTVRDAHLTHSVQRNWQIVEVQLDLNGMILRAEERTGDVFASIDAVVEKLEQQVKRLKGKLRNHKGRPSAVAVAATLAEVPEETAEDLPQATPDTESAQGVEAGPDPYASAGGGTGDGAGTGAEGGVVRRKRFAIKPMSVDEAALQLDLLHHDFFLFLNDETGEVNVLYRRREGDLGLLEGST